ncbi:hypothetical protein CPC08DRAFT_425076 [Agrocybe pediades]|nr:hypothetical protein CPC08DRAFT_425076 [Agrocybe pediades]
MSVATAQESDLEPFHKLHRVVLTNPVLPSTSNTSSLRNTNNNTLELQPPLRITSSFSDLRSSMPHNTLGEYTLSSNPPNPKTSFRLGDWICSSPNCAAHNFGRNLTCIGCGSPRSNNGNGSGSTLHHHQQHPHNNQLTGASSARAPPSPRFNNVTYYSSAPPPTHNFQMQPQQQQLHHQVQQSVRQQTIPQRATIGQQHSQPHLSAPSFGSSSSAHHHTAANPKSSHPLLTPSGRAFAIGGKVQNISSDPLSPCIMYWPDNEPFPEQGQIRPSGLVGVAPPILNTGNRGPISHQPGDWICQKCNYLNWRRRKVCQTCLPYAEGNGDSISAAVQAERIALLTSVLSQTQINGGNLNIPGVAQAPKPHSLTPPQVRRSLIDLTAPQPQITRSVHRSQSHFSLGQQYAASQSPVYTTSSPIYQTSGNRQETREPSPLYSTGPNNNRSSTATAVQQTLHVPGSDAASVPRSMMAHAGSAAGYDNHHNGTSNINRMVPSVTVHAPAPLLPSFLQDMVQSPALSPTSTTTSSADLSSIEEYEDVSSPRAVYPRARGDSGSSDASSAISNIWRLDGEESKSLSAFPLPNHQELVGARKNGVMVADSLRA